MSRSDVQRLDDIREMCARAADLVERGRQALDEDEALWLALERIVEVAGEAATQLTDSAKAQYPGADWKGAVRSRIIYAHQYHRIDRDLLWNTATTSLPALLRELGPPGYEAVGALAALARQAGRGEASPRRFRGSNEKEAWVAGNRLADVEGSPGGRSGDRGEDDGRTDWPCRAGWPARDGHAHVEDAPIPIGSAAPVAGHP